MSQESVLKLLRKVADNYLLANISIMMGETPISYWMKTFWDWDTDRGPVVTSAFAMNKKLERIQKNPRGCILLWKSDGSDMEEKPVILVQGKFKLQKNLNELTTHDATLWLRFLPRWYRINPEFMAVGIRLIADGQKDHPLVEWFMHRVIITLIPEKIYCWADSDVNKEPEIVEV
jgi:hypothetical protein